MRRYRKALIGVTIFLLCSVAVTWMVFATLAREVSGSTNSYSATFTDVSGLATGDDVRVAGVRVGRVDKIDLVGTQAKVTFRVQRNQPLYTDTRASVTYQNVIGQRYLGLADGNGANRTLLGNHGHIPVEHTNPSFDISYTLNGFEPLFTQLDPEQVDNLTNALVQAFQGDSTSLLVLTTQTSVLAQTFAGPDQVLGDLIGNLNTLMTNMAAQNTNLQNMIRESRAVMANLANRREELVDSVGSINRTVGRLASIVDNVMPDAQQFVSRQPGFLDYGLHQGRERLAYMIANTPGLLKGFARIFQEGAYVNLAACDIDFGFWRGLYFWFRAFVAAATPGNGNELWHTPACR